MTITDKQLNQSQANIRKEQQVVMPTPLTQTATQSIFDKCERCGYGIRLTDKELCGRCTRMLIAKKQLSPITANNRIMELVGEHYAQAENKNVDADIREQIKTLEYGENLYIFGMPGTGKTYLMAAMIRHYIFEGYSCERINFDDFCVKLRSTMTPAAKVTEWDLIEPLKQVDKLFIDDLGLSKQEETRYSYQTFYSILNKRIERMLPTIICSNKTVEQIGRNFDARIASRLDGAKQIEFTGRDRRIK